MFDKAGFVPSGIESFGIASPMEHWEIIFITKMHMYDVWHEIYSPESVNVEVLDSRKQDTENK
jgi:hypothetical protein